MRNHHALKFFLFHICYSAIMRTIFVVLDLILFLCDNNVWILRCLVNYRFMRLWSIGLLLLRLLKSWDFLLYPKMVRFTKRRLRNGALCPEALLIVRVQMWQWARVLIQQTMVLVPPVQRQMLQFLVLLIWVIQALVELQTVTWESLQIIYGRLNFIRFHCPWYVGDKLFSGTVELFIYLRVIVIISLVAIVGYGRVSDVTLPWDWGSSESKMWQIGLCFCNGWWWWVSHSWDFLFLSDPCDPLEGCGVLESMHGFIFGLTLADITKVTYIYISLFVTWSLSTASWFG